MEENDQTLSKSESVVTLGIAATSVEKDREYVTVKEIANYLDRSPTTVRTYLNKIERIDIAESEAQQSIDAQSAIDPREKFWTLTYGIDYHGVESLLEDHPEIEEQIVEEDIDAVLSGLPQTESHQTVEEPIEFPSRKRIDELIDDYPEVVEYFGDRDAVYELFDVSEE